MTKSVFTLLCATALMSGCGTIKTSEAPRIVDFSGTQQPKETCINQENEPIRALYRGFSIAPSQAAWLVFPSRQRPTRANWIMTDPQDRLHTTVAIVSCSPPLSPEQRKLFNLQSLDAQLARHIPRVTARICDPKYESRLGSRHGIPSIEFHCEALDTASRHSKKPLKLYISGFALLTKDGRLLNAQVSERRGNPDRPYNRKTADEFLSRIDFRKR